MTPPPSRWEQGSEFHLPTFTDLPPGRLSWTDACQLYASGRHCALCPTDLGPYRVQMEACLGSRATTASTSCSPSNRPGLRSTPTLMAPSIKGRTSAVRT